MADGDLPLLVLPAPSEIGRGDFPSRGGQKIKRPSNARQRERLSPQFQVLQDAFEAKRVKLSQQAPLQDPEMVLVLEVAGLLDKFANAVAKIPGLEWLAEATIDEIEPDEDFSVDGKDDKPFSGRLFLIGTNSQALEQLVALWEHYKDDPTAKFERGLTKFRDVFQHLVDIRFWNVSDRIDADMRLYWQERIDQHSEFVRFEIEAFYFTSAHKNDAVRDELQALVGQLEGQVIQRLLMPEIGYHGFLVELPAAAIQAILDGEVPELLLSDRVMYFRPRPQAFPGTADEMAVQEAPPIEGASNGPPVVALLDGLPMQNHPLLQGRLDVDDPDDWSGEYEVKDRVHGTAMASLILLGDLGGDAIPITSRLYVRPILRPDPTDNFNPRRDEHIPDDYLLVDLVHRAVKRICEGDAGGQPIAPTVRVVNLSIGDSRRVFSRDLCPWARLLDWLAWRYSLLFVVSAGNIGTAISLQTPQNSLAGLPEADRVALAFSAVVADSSNRRIIAPAEAVNALTVGALHHDESQVQPAPGRYDLFIAQGISPFSRIGHGYKRSVKPEILMPGGRGLHSEKIEPGAAVTTVQPVRSFMPPGQKTAIPPVAGQPPAATAYTRGTSSAAALTSRAAARIHEMLSGIRAQQPDVIPPNYDALLIKALLVHGASWGDLSTKLLAERPDIAQIQNANSRRVKEKDFIARWLGYGVANLDRVLGCTAERATLLGVGTVRPEHALVFSCPLPPTLAGKVVWRRLTATLAWFSPTNPAHQAYRRAKLWLTSPSETLRVKRENSVYEKAALRGTIQHEVLEGDEALAFVDGAMFTCHVHCAADAGGLEEEVPFALCVSLEVGINAGIPIYEEIRQRIQAPVAVGINP